MDEIRSSFSYSLGEPPSYENGEKTLRITENQVLSEPRERGQFVLRSLPSRAGCGGKYRSTSSREKMKKWMAKL